jgi:serine/threonine protein kinase
MGTPAYISPEQAQGQTVDRRSDIYSLGIILYEMVTGSVPYIAETPLAVLLKHISDPLPPPSLVKPDVPLSIEQVILKALAKDPRDRFGTVDEFLTAWKRALEQKETVRREPEITIPPIPAQLAQRKPAPVTRTTSKAIRPAGWIVGCLAALCLVFSVGGVAVLALNLPIFSPSPVTETPLPPTPTVTLVPPTARLNTRSRPCACAILRKIMWPGARRMI